MERILRTKAMTDAVKLEGQVVDAQRVVFGHKHPDPIKSLKKLAHTYTLHGRHDEAKSI